MGLRFGGGVLLMVVFDAMRCDAPLLGLVLGREVRASYVHNMNLQYTVLRCTVHVPTVHVPVHCTSGWPVARLGLIFIRMIDD